MTLLRSARRGQALALAAVALVALCGCGQSDAASASSPLSPSTSSAAVSGSATTTPAASSSATTSAGTGSGTAPTSATSTAKAPGAPTDALTISAPGEGEHLPAGVMGIVGTGTAPEGTLLWKITQADGTELDSGYTDAGANGAVGDFSIQQTVQQGSCQPCTVAVWVPDDSDGEGVPTAAVKRTFWVD